MSILPRLLRPRPAISDRELGAGLRWLTLEGVVASGFGAIVTSGVLTAFALALGASSFQIGLLAALPFLTQSLQIPAVLLAERLRYRKATVVLSFLPNQLLWLPIALVPFVFGVPSKGAVVAFLSLIFLRGVVGAFTSTSWNSWLRDLVPQSVFGRFFARRSALSNMTAIVIGLGATVYMDFWLGRFPDNEAFGYSIAVVLGALTLGIASPICMALMPEPQARTPEGGRPPALSALAAPARDPNYRRVLRFQLLWGFAANLATPFFAVYMLQRLGMPLSQVMLLTILGQVFNLAFLPVWGAFTDRFGSKAVLSAAGSLYLLIFLGWTFTTMPERYALTVPLLALLYALNGVAGAGVGVSSGALTMKLAPLGQATPYLAACGLASSIGGSLGALAGGQFAGYLDARQLSLVLSWNGPGHVVSLPAMHLAGLDFLFLGAFALGVLAVRFLAVVREEGEARREDVLEALLAHARQSPRGAALLQAFPFESLRRLPVPGLDVAVSVATYQASEVVRLASAGIAFIRGLTSRGRATESPAVRLRDRARPPVPVRHGRHGRTGGEGRDVHGDDHEAETETVTGGRT